MTTMNIKDPEVHRLARELALRRGTSATGAVREALREALSADAARRTGTAQRLLELAAQSRAIAEPLLTDADLYDQHGLPR